MTDQGEANQPPRSRGRWGCFVILIFAIVLGCVTWIPMGHGGLPLILLPFAAVHNLYDRIGEKAASIGEPLVGSGSAHPVSDQFGKPELQQLYTRLTSDAFHAALTNYNCGDPVPQFKFAVILMNRRPASSRRVDVIYAPYLEPAGRSRCLMFRLDGMVDKACHDIDPHPEAIGYEGPHAEQECDCSKRDGTQEWVTWKETSPSDQK